jgi:hypothetical protein
MCVSGARHSFDAMANKSISPSRKIRANVNGRDLAGNRRSAAIFDRTIPYFYGWIKR